MTEQPDRRRVRVTYDPIAQRWELADDGFGGRTELETRDDGVSIGRTASGTIVELVLDADDGDRSTSEHVALQLVTDSFGPQVADLLRRGAPDGDLDLVIDVVGFAPAPRTAPPTAPIAPGEPGIPTPRPDGSYTVPTGHTVLTLEVYADRLVIRAPRGGSSTNDWAVVATADGGDVVAMGPMEPSGDGGTAAHLGFGLPLPPDSLYVTTTAEPLAAIDERATRQRRWAYELLDQADRALRLRPRTAKHSAKTALTVGTALSDQRIIDRATRTMDRARRRRWLWAGIALVVAASASAALVGSDDGSKDPSSPTESTVYFANCDAARAAGPTPLRRDDPGYRAGLDRDGDGVACEG